MISVTRPNPSRPDQVDDETRNHNERPEASATTSTGVIDARYERREGGEGRGGGEVGMSGMMRIMG